MRGCNTISAMQAINNVSGSILNEVSLVKKKLNQSEIFDFYVKGIQQSCEQIFEFSLILSTRYIETYQKFKICIESGQKMATDMNSTLSIFRDERFIYEEDPSLIESSYVLSRNTAVHLFNILCDYTDCNMYDVIMTIITNEENIPRVSN